MRRGEVTSGWLRLTRYARLLFQLLLGLLTVALLFPFYSQANRWRAVQNWSRRVLHCIGVELRLHGEVPAPGSGVMGVANHISWLDIHVLHSAWQVRFVAKAEVSRWPLIGWLSARAGTLFVDRSSHRRSARINREIDQALARGEAVAVFPEGMTTWGDQLLRFHASLLQPAVNEQAQVVPVAIRYTDGAGNRQPAAGYVGDMSLMQSIAAIVRVPRIIAEVTFLPAIESQGCNRRELALTSHARIAAALRLPPAGS